MKNLPSYTMYDPDSLRDYTEVLFDESIDVNEEHGTDMDQVNQLVRTEFDLDQKDELDWRDDVTLWIWTGGYPYDN